MKNYTPDIELIKIDLRYFVKELERQKKIDLNKTIIFVLTL